VPPSEPDFFRIIEVLGRHRVDYILVGGLCGLLHGAPISTFDMDIVHSRTPENLDRLLLALQELGAIYRHSPHRRLVPGLSHLAAPGHQLLATDAGPLDVLGTIGNGRGFEELLDTTSEIDVDGCRIRVLDLDQLIVSKEEAGRDQDLAVLPILRQTLALQQAGKKP